MEGELIRAAVISDTHGLLRPEVEQVVGTCDVVIHAGDFDHQMLYHKLAVRQPLYAVRGHNDGNWAAALPLVKRFTLGGVRFIMAHERSDIPMALDKEQVVIFGHSHTFYQQTEEGRLWLNPGSCGRKRFALPLSLAVMTIQDKRIQVEPVWLEGGQGLGKAFWPAGAGESLMAGPGKDELGNFGTQSESQPAKRAKAAPAVKAKDGRRDELFLIARIMRLMKRGETISWVARNVKSDPGFVETVCRICVTHPGADARQILDKLEVNRLYSRK